MDFEGSRVYKMSKLMFDKVMRADVPWLTRNKKKCAELTGAKQQALTEQWQQRYQHSEALVIQRSSQQLNIHYPQQLPVSQHHFQIKSLIEHHQVVIVAGETGSGKTTQIPKMCAELGLANRAMIGHTQPRRLAATSIASRLAKEMSASVGQQVGLKIRFQDKTSSATLIKLMTDGVLLNEIQHEPLLLAYQVIIIDEAHERSLNIDFILGYLKRLLPKRPDLKIIITSATIDVDLFSAHFNDAPVINVSGRQFAVESYYLDDAECDEARDTLAEQVHDAIKSIERQERQGQWQQLAGGNILVFFATERDIRETLKYLQDNGFNKSNLFPLYGRLSQQDQNKIFSGSSSRKIILSTNIAETSLTIPGVKYVIDSGKVRLSRFNYKSKIQQLPVEWISKASANQRQGRCGREGPGVCFRLYSEAEFDQFSEQTTPEILRTNLAAVLLMALNLGINNIAEFPFIQPPDPKYIKAAYLLLEELGAIDESGRKLTRTGKALAQLAVDPRLARIILAGNDYGCQSEAIIITAFLALADPREVPLDRQDYAKNMHARFNDKGNQSDFITILNLWAYVQNQQQTLSNNAFRKLCLKECLNFNRLREWQDLTKLLAEQSKHKRTDIDVENLPAANIHRACLAGLLSHIGHKQQEHSYMGARQRPFYVFPASQLFKKKPLWLMSASLIETTKLYGRICAEIDNEWLLTQAKHLLKFRYAEPHWSKKQKKAMIYRSSLLYGLIIKEQEKVPLKTIDETLAREMFIKAVLVDRTLTDYIKPTPAFWQHNEAQFKALHELEAKFRRFDIIADEEAIFHAYDKQLPESVIDLVSFKHYLKTQPQAQEKLKLSKAALSRIENAQQRQAQFPDQIKDGNLTLPLKYHFEVGAVDDGVSVMVPIEQLMKLNPSAYDYLVPGLLQEKCLMILKTLAKTDRKRINPLADLALEVCCQPISQDLSIIDWLCLQVKKIKGVMFNSRQFKLDKLDPYYLMNFKVFDKNNQLLAQDRDLAHLQKALVTHFKPVALEQSDNSNQQTFSDWTFTDLTRCAKQAGIALTNNLYPFLKWQGDKAMIDVSIDEAAANYQTRQALIGFIRLKHGPAIKQMQKQILKGSKALHMSQVANLEQLKEDFTVNVINQTYLREELPKNRDDYQQRLQTQQAELFSLAIKYEVALLSAYDYKHQVDMAIAALPEVFIEAKKELEKQRDNLFCQHYQLMAGENLLSYPRYLKAMLHRIEKLKLNYKNDLALSKSLQKQEKDFWQYVDDDYTKLLIQPDLNHFRFLLEEMRISLFAQSIKTKEKISFKRLEKYWQKICQ